MTTTASSQPARRQRGQSSALYVRVRPGFKEKADRAAAAAGVSLATYIEQLLARDQVDDAGLPVWWPESVPFTQEAMELQPDTAA